MNLNYELTIYANTAYGITLVGDDEIVTRTESFTTIEDIKQDLLRLRDDEQLKVTGVTREGFAFLRDTFGVSFCGVKQ